VFWLVVSLFSFFFQLMGHAPLFADADFADFSQEIGLASIGATDEQIEHLARCYWFRFVCISHTSPGFYSDRISVVVWFSLFFFFFFWLSPSSVEFGLCLQGGERKAYGAGLLSSFGELEYSMTDKPEVRAWDPFNASKQEYPITTYQPVYYMASSFEDAKKKMQDFSNSLSKPFNTRYDPYTGTLEVDRHVVMEVDAPK
jgi:phenylalanine-4-hydroxylase